MKIFKVMIIVFFGLCSGLVIGVVSDFFGYNPMGVRYTGLTEFQTKAELVAEIGGEKIKLPSGFNIYAYANEVNPNYFIIVGVPEVAPLEKLAAKNYKNER